MQTILSTMPLLADGQLLRSIGTIGVWVGLAMAASGLIVGLIVRALRGPKRDDPGKGPDGAEKP